MGWGIDLQHDERFCRPNQWFLDRSLDVRIRASYCWAEETRVLVIRVSASRQEVPEALLLRRRPRGWVTEPIFLFRGLEACRVWLLGAPEPVSEMIARL